MTAAEWINEQEADNEQETDEVTENFIPEVYTIAAFAQMNCAPRFIINDGGKWTEETSRMHCCEVVYRDKNYIERRIKKWDLTIQAAYRAAVEAWQEVTA